MKITSVIVAGGNGSRMGSDTPKQFLLLGGVPVLMRTIEAVHQSVSNYVNNFIIVLPSSQIEYWNELCKAYNFSIQHQVVAGGTTRFNSVKNGVALVQNSDLVLIHDGVRPFITAEIIEPTIKAALEHGAAVPVTEIVDSLRKVYADCSQIVNRADYRAVQTPQIFRREVIVEAYGQPYDPIFTDDASVVERMGCRIILTPGSSANIKITTPHDLQYANIVNRYE